MNETQEYVSIAVGLLVGTLAHFGRVIAAGTMPSWASVIGFLMQLGLIGVIAMVLTSRLGITDVDVRALTTAILAISAQEVIQYIKRSGWQSLTRTVIPPAPPPDPPTN